MLTFIVENYLLVVLSIGFIILLFNNLSMGTNKSNKLKELLISVAILTIYNSIETYLGRLDSFHYFRIVCSFMCYTLRPFVIISFISLITDNKSIKYFKYLSIVNCLIYSTCFFSDIAFTISKDNFFHRGPLGYSSHIFCFFYLALLVFFIIKKHNKHNRMRTLLISYMAITCVFGFLIDWYTSTTSIFDDVILIDVLIYYLYLYTENKKVDVLTSAFNRGTFYSDVARYGNKITSVVSIDMNDLKKTNDTYGHDEGDKALRTISDILLNVDKKYVRVYRVGGDEFVVLGFYKDKDKIKDYINKVKDELKETSYSCSFGYVLNDNVSNIDELYKRADSLMYVEKEKYHSKNKKNNKK